MPRKLTNEEFVENARKVHGNKYDYSKSVYVNATTLVKIICPIHGEFEQRPVNHINAKQGCPKCSHQSYPSNKELFIEKAKKIYGDKYLYDKVVYKNNKSKVIITCPKHGDFEVRVDNFLHGHGCKKCGIESRVKIRSLGQDEFLKRANDLYGDTFDYTKTKYENYEKKVIITCKKHGDFLITPDNFLNGHNCPHCSTSKLELKVKKILNDNKILYEQQKTFKWLKMKSYLKLDFYLPEFNIAIECHGLQHFRPIDIFGGIDVFKETIERDAVKYKLCKEHGVSIIYYSDVKDKTPDNVIKKEKILLEKIYGKDIDNT